MAPDVSFVAPVKSIMVESVMATFVENRPYNTAAPARVPEPKKRPIPAEFLQDYLAAVVDAQQFKVSNLRNWNLIQGLATRHEVSLLTFGADPSVPEPLAEAVCSLS